MHNQRIAILISAIAGIIATFLPFMNIWFMKVSLIETKDGTGYVIIAAFAVSLIVTLIGNPKNVITKGHLIGVIIPGLIPAVLLLIFLMKFLNDEILKTLSIFGIGYYLALAASFAILFFGLSLKGNYLAENNVVKNKSIYCSECGKEQSSEIAGEFCEECGNKL